MIRPDESKKEDMDKRAAKEGRGRRIWSAPNAIYEYSGGNATKNRSKLMK